MIITDLDTQAVLADYALLADTPFSRMNGLLGRRSLEPGEALVITHCQSIHMFFMRFSIDVVFTDRQGIVVGVVERIGPFRLSPIFWKAYQAVELPAGTAQNRGVLIGHRLSFL